MVNSIQLHYLVFDGTSYWVTDENEVLNNFDIEYVQETSSDINYLTNLAEKLNCIN